jgi:hypothetical protein
MPTPKELLSYVLVFGIALWIVTICLWIVTICVVSVVESIKDKTQQREKE